MSSDIKGHGAALAQLSSTKPKPSKTAQQAAYTRASKALANAKQRCENPKNPDYHNYGGVGVLFLVSNTTALVQAIGLPKPEQSLDRIDPNGHYEIGNVRWATAAVQAANKKLSSTNAHLLPWTQIDAAKEALASQADRKVTAVAYKRSLRAFNTGSMPRADAEWLRDNLPVSGVLEASFDFNTVHDWSNESPGFLHLPALSLPRARVRIRCFPLVELPEADHVQKAGRLDGLEHTPIELNVPKPVWQRVREVIEEEGPGVILCGSPNAADLLGGWTEGWCLAMASACATELRCRSVTMPCLRVVQMLKELGSPQSWDEVNHQILDARVLFVPDFSLDCGSWGELGGSAWYSLGSLLSHRYQRSLTTVVGVQNPQKLHPAVKQIVLGAYRLVTMPKTKPHELAALKYAAACHSVYSGSITRGDMMLDPLLSRIVVSDGELED